MMEDDEPGIDLGAWEAPPPPAGLADAVLARMREPRRSSARLTAPAPAATPRRWWWIAVGSVAAAAAGVAAAVQWGVARAPADGHGDVFAARATHLELAPSSVELDLGAELRWQRAGRRITVAQPRGATTWRVDTSDILAIDAGAAVASVEATGASLRVEVQMNVSDAKVAGASAAIAALVTVVVYNGRVTVTGSGQTLIVPPGTTVEVARDESPREVLAVGAAADRVRQLEERLRALEAERTAAAGDRQQQRVLGGPDPDAPSDPQPPACDEVSCVLGNYADACCERFRKPVSSGALDHAAIAKGVALAEGAVLACGDGTFSGALIASLKVAPDGSVTSVKLRPPRASIGRCVKTALAAARFEQSKLGGSFSHAFAFAPAPAPAPAPASCRARDLASKGSDAYIAGSYREAFTAFEQAYKCEPRPGYGLRAFMTACKLGDRDNAARYHQLHPTETRKAMAVCVGAGISEAELARAPAPAPAPAPACDLAKLMAQGTDAYVTGDYRRALASFEDAWACKGGPAASLRAFMSACKLADRAKATHYYRAAPVEARKASSICNGVGITNAELEGSTPCDFEALLSAGDGAYAAGQYRPARDSYDLALTCKRDDRAILRAFMAACKVADKASAVRYSQMSPSAVRPAIQICIASGVTQEQLGLGAPATTPSAARVPPARPITVPPSALRALQIAGSMDIVPDAAVRAAIAAAGKGKLVGSFKLCVDAAGTPVAVKQLKSTGVAAFDAAIEREIRGWRFRPYLDHGTAVAACTAVTVIHGNSACNADDLKSNGVDEYARGNYAAALAMFELSLGCERDPNTTMKAFMAACRLANRAKAKQYYKQAPTEARKAMALCIAEGIEEDELARR